jgi:hypothetical protein
LEATNTELANAERSAYTALAIMFEEAGRVAASLNEAKQKVWDLANQLRGFGRLWMPTGTTQALRPIALSAGSPLCSRAGRAPVASAHATRRKVSSRVELISGPLAQVKGARGLRIQHQRKPIGHLVKFGRYGEFFSFACFSSCSSRPSKSFVVRLLMV